MKYEIDIFHYLDVYKKHLRRMAFLIGLTVFIIIPAVQSMKPATYRSTLIALSSKEAGQASNIGKFFGLSVNASSDDTIFSILKSRRMQSDINEHFNLKSRPRSWWSLDTYVVTGGFAIEVTGSDPELTRDVANFAAEDVDEINKDLKITTELRMVKVLDPAIKGTRMNKDVSKKAIASGLFVFLVYTLFIFFREYFSQLKRSKGQ